MSNALVTGALERPRSHRRAGLLTVTTVLAAALIAALPAGPAAAAPGDRVVCPSTFQVLHNDRIGELEIPAGAYRITVRRMTCPNASDKFRKFLNYPNGRLPDNWTLRVSRAKFRNPQTAESFRIKRTGN